MRTMKRAAIGIAIMAGIGIIAGVYVLVRDVVFTRDDTGKLQATLGKVKEKDQLFAFAGRDIKQLEITVREVDYDEGDEGAAADEDSDGAKSDEGKRVEEKQLGLARVGDEWVLTKPVHALAAEGEVELGPDFVEPARAALALPVDELLATMRPLVEEAGRRIVSRWFSTPVNPIVMRQQEGGQP